MCDNLDLFFHSLNFGSILLLIAACENSCLNIRNSRFFGRLFCFDYSVRCRVLGRSLLIWNLRYARALCGYCFIWQPKTR